jgi:glycine hydroxymethyltransferase
MEMIARLIWWTAVNYEEKADGIRKEVAKLCEKYPLYD